MATHSSILARIIPWTEESGRLQCMGLQRVKQNWVSEHMHTHTHTHMHTIHCDWHPYKKKDLDAERCREGRWMEDPGSTSHECEGRDSGDAFTRQAKSEKGGHSFLLTTIQKNQLHQHLNRGLLEFLFIVSRIVSNKCCGLSYPICGTLFW